MTAAPQPDWYDGPAHKLKASVPLHLRNELCDLAREGRPFDLARNRLSLRWLDGLIGYGLLETYLAIGDRLCYRVSALGLHCAACWDEGYLRKAEDMAADQLAVELSAPGGPPSPAPLRMAPEPDETFEVDPITGGRMSVDEAKFRERQAGIGAPFALATHSRQYDDDFDRRLLAVVYREGCLVGVKGVQAHMPDAWCSHIQASLFRLVERKSIIWDVTGSLYLSDTEYERFKKAKESDERPERD